MKRILVITILFLTNLLNAQLTPEQLYESASKNCFVVVNKSDNSFGTGFLLTNGYVVTNLHVVQGASPTEITLRPINNTNEIIACEKLYVSSKRDIAVIKPLSKLESPGLEIDTIPPKIGSNVYVIGNSKGFTGTFSDGLVSQIQEAENGDTWLQMSAPISSGNSGGPVMNKLGRVVGISTLSHRFGQNLNFAVPSKYITDFLNTNGISPELKKSEEQTLAKTEEKAKSYSELEKVRALFTPKQLELVEEVDDIYLQRNIRVSIFGSVILSLIVFMLVKYKKSDAKSLLAYIRYCFREHNEIIAGLYITLPIILFIVYRPISDDYPSFFKSKLQFIEEKYFGRSPLSAKSIFSIPDENSNDHYKFLLNQTYYGNDAALLFLADGILTGELVQPADTIEALKWFKVLMDKNYYPGYIVHALKYKDKWQGMEENYKSANDYFTKAKESKEVFFKETYKNDWGDNTYFTEIAFKWKKNNELVNQYIDSLKAQEKRWFDNLPEVDYEHIYNY